MYSLGKNKFINLERKTVKINIKELLMRKGEYEKKIRKPISMICFVKHLNKKRSKLIKKYTNGEELLKSIITKLEKDK